MAVAVVLVASCRIHVSAAAGLGLAGPQLPLLLLPAGLQVTREAHSLETLQFHSKPK